MRSLSALLLLPGAGGINLTLHAFQSPDCEHRFQTPDLHTGVYNFVWLDFPTQILHLLPEGALKQNMSDVGTWCDPSRWWPLSLEETRARELIGVTTEMAVLGCQYFGNSNSFFYNARNLGFKGFLIANMATSERCGFAHVINGSFPSEDYKRRMSVCSELPLFTAPLGKGDNVAFDRVGYLEQLVPSLFELYYNPAPAFPSLFIEQYRCDVMAIGNSVGFFLAVLLLVFVRAFVFFKSLLLLRQLAFRADRLLASVGLLFGGVLGSVASAFELIAFPNELPGVNYWPVHGPKDGVVAMYLPICLEMCSNIALACLWLKLGLNRRLKTSRRYEVVGVLLCVLPLPILLPLMTSRQFDTYAYKNSQTPVVINAVLSGMNSTEMLSLALAARERRDWLFSALNNTIFWYAAIFAAAYTSIQYFALTRIFRATLNTRTLRSDRVLRRLVSLVVVQTVCLIGQAVLVFYYQTIALSVMADDNVPGMLAIQLVRVGFAALMMWAQVMAFSSASSSTVDSSEGGSLYDGRCRDSSIASERNSNNELAICKAQSSKSGQTNSMKKTPSVRDSKWRESSRGNSPKISLSEQPSTNVLVAEKV